MEMSMEIALADGSSPDEMDMDTSTSTTSLISRHVHDLELRVMRLERMVPPHCILVSYRACDFVGRLFARMCQCLCVLMMNRARGARARQPRYPEEV